MSSRDAQSTPLLAVQNGRSISDHDAQQWSEFLATSISPGTRNVFSLAGIQSLDQLTATTAHDLYRRPGFGKFAITEVRLALAALNRSLAGEPVYKPIEPVKRDELLTRLDVLEQQRRELSVQIAHLKGQIWANNPRPASVFRSQSVLDRKVFKRWNKLKNYSKVARDLGVSTNKVRTVVIRRLATCGGTSP